MRELLDQILAHHTGQTVEKIAHDTDRDFIMSAAEAQGVRHRRRGHHATASWLGVAAPAGVS